MGLVRLYLAVAVVITHSELILGLPVLKGRTAVECFFVISGFYMAMVLDQKYLHVRRPWLTFMSARLFRLYPLYLIVFALTLVLLAAGGSVYIASEPQLVTRLFALPWPTALTLGLSNLVLVGQEGAFFFGIDTHGLLYFTTNFREVDVGAYQFYVVPQAWTVGLEIAFYALAPFLARRRTRTLLVILGLSISLRVVFALVFGLRLDPWSYRFFPFELSLFLAGMLVYRFRAVLVGRLPVATHLIVTFALLLLFPLLEVAPQLYNLAMNAFPFAFALLVPGVFAFTSKNKVDRWIGELSYPLYLVHVLAIGVVVAFGNSLPVAGTTAVIASLLATLILVYSVDRPLERLRQRRIGLALAGQRAETE